MTQHVLQHTTHPAAPGGPARLRLVGDPPPSPAPGPRRAAIPLSLRRFRRDAPSYFCDLRREYGDMVRLPLGFFTVHLPFHPQAISYVLQGHNANFVRGKGYDFFRPFMGTGLLTTDGQEWKSRRLAVNPLFHRTAIEGMGTAMVEATGRVLDRWEAAGDGDVDVVPEMMHVTLDALGRAMFDTDLEPDHDAVGPAMNTAVQAMVFRGEPRQLVPLALPTPYNRRLRHARDQMYAVIARIVAAHRAGHHGDRLDLVSLLLAAQDADSGTALSDDDVRDELMTVFMAGHETTGSGLAWALAELAHNPAVQEGVRAEVDRVLAGRPPTLADLGRLTYTRQVVDETLRLHPPIWVFPRDAVADDVVGGHLVRAGESVFITPYVTHRHPEFWAAPHRFDPERFAPGAVSERPRHAYIPFGAGQRKCIGNAMALQQTHLTLAMVAQRFTVAPAPGYDDRLATFVSLRPPAGLRLTLRSRS